MEMGGFYPSPSDCQAWDFVTMVIHAILPLIYYDQLFSQLGIHVSTPFFPSPARTHGDQDGVEKNEVGIFQ